ncbi:hypothetical protein B566_EDAN002091, partial [Ephemera danica]
MSSAKKAKLDSKPITHDTLHSALRKKDCALVRHLIISGVTPCSTNGIENCFVLIIKYWNVRFLERMLLAQPSAVHSRGPDGLSLSMYAEDPLVIETLVMHNIDIEAVNSSGDNLLLYAVKEYVRSASALQIVSLQSILKTGIDIDKRDLSGKTALDYVLEGKTCNWLVVKLLEAGATIPPPVESRTALMKAVRDLNHEDVDIVVALLHRGADARARDKDGHNAMYHAISTLRQSRDMYHVVSRVSRVCYELLQHGCELDGLDIMFESKSNMDFQEFSFITRVTYNILSLILRYSMYSHFIMELKGPNLKMLHPNSVSLLTSYFLGFHRWQYHPEELQEIEATVTHLLDNEVEVTQRILGFDDDETEANAWSMELKLPDALWLATQIMLRIPVDKDYHYSKKAYTIISTILVSLLRFWPHPPLALMLFPFELCHSKDIEVPLGMLTLNFLTRIGGPLPPGSLIMQALKEKFAGDPIRATLRRTNKTGLDLSSLQTLVNGHMREIPKSVQDFLSFSDQPAFEVNDVPLVLRMRFLNE